MYCNHFAMDSFSTQFILGILPKGVVCSCIVERIQLSWKVIRKANTGTEDMQMSNFRQEKSGRGVINHSKGSFRCHRKSCALFSAQPSQILYSRDVLSSGECSVRANTIELRTKPSAEEAIQNSKNITYQYIQHADLTHRLFISIYK